MGAPTFRFDDPPADDRMTPMASMARASDGPMPSPSATAIDAERARLARATARGIGMPLAGMLYWLAVAALVRAFPLKSALFWSYVATGAVFPVGLLLTRAVGGDLFAKSERFTSLGMLFNAMQLVYWPVIIVLGIAAPAWVPFAMATLFGSHFLGYAWLYRSRGYAVLAVGTAVVLTAAIALARGPLTATVPLLAAGVYAIAVALLYREVVRDR